MPNRTLPAIGLLRLTVSGGVFLAIMLTAGPGPAEDLDTSAFDRCKACHEIRDGETVIVPGGRNGPNLFGVIGRQAGALPDYSYSAGLLAAGEAGLVFDTASMEAYAANPNGFLATFMDGNTRSKMPLGFPKYAAAAAQFLSELKTP